MTLEEIIETESWEGKNLCNKIGHFPLLDKNGCCTHCGENVREEMYHMGVVRGLIKPANPYKTKG